MAQSTGAFLFVLAGAIAAAGRQLGLWESVFVSADEALEVAAGSAGAELVALHVPPTEPAYAPR